MFLLLCFTWCFRCWLLNLSSVYSLSYLQLRYYLSLANLSDITTLVVVIPWFTFEKKTAFVQCYYSCWRPFSCQRKNNFLAKFNTWLLCLFRKLYVLWRIYEYTPVRHLMSNSLRTETDNICLGVLEHDYNNIVVHLEVLDIQNHSIIV